MNCGDSHNDFSRLDRELAQWGAEPIETPDLVGSIHARILTRQRRRRGGRILKFTASALAMAAAVALVVTLWPKEPVTPPGSVTMVVHPATVPGGGEAVVQISHQPPTAMVERTVSESEGPGTVLALTGIARNGWDETEDVFF